MNIQIISEDEFILRNMSEIAEAQNRSDKSTYSSTYEYGLTELVRIYMRDIAQDSNKYIQSDKILIDEAYNKATSEIHKRTGVDFKDKKAVNLYENINKKLKYTAKEITSLKENLETSKQVERIGKRQRLLGPESSPYEIIELGLKDRIEGLLAVPLVKDFDIDFDRANDRFEIKGDWFPFEIKISEFVFALDDDGSIFTSTENFPEPVFKDAYEQLHEIAQTIYTQS